MRFFTMLGPWIMSWFHTPKLSENLRKEQEKLIKCVASEMAIKGSEQTAAIERKISNATATYVHFVALSYPRKPIPHREYSAAKRHAFLSKPSRMLQNISVRSIRHIQQISSLSVDELEVAWQHYSDWREEQFDKPLMSETWRAFYHLLSPSRFIW